MQLIAAHLLEYLGSIGLNGIRSPDQLASRCGSMVNPPITCRFSRTTASRPAILAYASAIIPAGPPPTITTSKWADKAKTSPSAPAMPTAPCQFGKSNGLARRNKRHLYPITMAARRSRKQRNGETSLFGILKVGDKLELRRCQLPSGLPYESPRLQAIQMERFHIGGTAMIGATVLRALVLTAVFFAALSPATCLGENSNRLPP